MADPPDELSSFDLSTPPGFRVGDETAMSKRPWRLEFFESITRKLESIASGQPRVLELGSAQGFLARYVLEQLPTLPHYVLLDAARSMHALARERLAQFAARASFLERDFRQPSWSLDLGPFDAVVTMHAVQALRDKQPAALLHAQVRSVLSPQGLYLLCDQELSDDVDPDTVESEALAPANAAQERSLHGAGFGKVERIAQRGPMVLFQAR